MLKIIEVSGESNKSWEDAAANAVAQASKGVLDVKSVFIKDQLATVEGGKVAKYRISASISFVADNPVNVFDLEGL